jgi:hypothetical protein
MWWNPLDVGEIELFRSGERRDLCEAYSRPTHVFAGEGQGVGPRVRAYDLCFRKVVGKHGRGRPGAAAEIQDARQRGGKPGVGARAEGASPPVVLP